MRSRAWRRSAGATAVLVALAFTLVTASTATASPRTVLAEMFGGSG